MVRTKAYGYSTCASPRSTAVGGRQRDGISLRSRGLVVWVPRASGIELERLGMQALADPSVRKIAIANPKHAPYGRAAEATMKTLGVYEAVRERLVYGENIAQTAQFVQTGAADIGMVALSLAVAPALKEAGR